MKKDNQSLLRLRYILPTIAALMFIITSFERYVNGPCVQRMVCEDLFWITYLVHLPSVLLIYGIHSILPNFSKNFTFVTISIFTVGLFINFYFGVLLEWLYLRINNKKR